MSLSLSDIVFYLQSHCIYILSFCQCFFIDSYIFLVYIKYSNIKEGKTLLKCLQKTNFQS